MSEEQQPGLNLDRPQEQGNQLSESARWEAMLATEGMPSEPGEDLGREALMKEMEIEGGDPEKDLRIRHALQRYYIFRGGMTHGEHKQVSQQIANEAGAEEDDVPIELVEEIAEEVGRALEAIIDEAKIIAKDPASAYLSHRVLIRRLTRFAEQNYPSMDRGVVDTMVLRASRTLPDLN